MQLPDTARANGRPTSLWRHGGGRERRPARRARAAAQRAPRAHAATRRRAAGAAVAVRLGCVVCARRRVDRPRAVSVRAGRGRRARARGAGRLERQSSASRFRADGSARCRGFRPRQRDRSAFPGPDSGGVRRPARAGDHQSGLANASPRAAPASGAAAARPRASPAPTDEPGERGGPDRSLIRFNPPAGDGQRPQEDSHDRTACDPR